VTPQPHNPDTSALTLLMPTPVERRGCYAPTTHYDDRPTALDDRPVLLTHALTSPFGHQYPTWRRPPTIEDPRVTFRKQSLDVPQAPNRGSPGLHRGGFPPAPRPHVPTSPGTTARPLGSNNDDQRRRPPRKKRRTGGVPVLPHRSFRREGEVGATGRPSPLGGGTRDAATVVAPPALPG
jgi:hypothetical protein